MLLDLPDHDSTAVAHRLEVDRLVGLVDLLVWVLDPQKYADAAVHDRYLRPLAAHAGVLLVVLNQVDRLAPDGARGCLADLRRLLDSEGLASVPVLAVSARTGAGLPELRAELARRVAARRAASDRLVADVRGAVAGLSSDAVAGAARRWRPGPRRARHRARRRGGRPRGGRGRRGLGPAARGRGHRLAAAARTAGGSARTRCAACT